jgi:hypothetical protein
VNKPRENLPMLYGNGGTHLGTMPHQILPYWDIPKRKYKLEIISGFDTLVPQGVNPLLNFYERSTTGISQHPNPTTRI